MKTERRHQLETNELADSLAHWVDSAKPYLRTAAGLLIAAVVLAFAYAFVSRHSAEKAQVAWDEYFQAFNQMNREKFDDVADKYPGTPAAWWARTIVGDMNLDEGSNLLFRDRPRALDKLNSAVEEYGTVLKEAKESAVLVRASYGQARAQEGLGQLKEARESYSAIVSRWPTNALAEVAQARIKDLDNSDTKEFYDWFRKQNPGKSMLDQPGKPGEKPNFDLNTLNPHSKSPFPDEHEHDGPALPDDGQTPADDKAPAEESAPNDGATGDGAPADSTPADKQPAPK